MYKKLTMLAAAALILALLASTSVTASVLDRRIDNDDDDAEQMLDSATADATSSDLELPYEDVNQVDIQAIGLRFSDISIPPNAPIVSAYVQFQVDETKGGTEPVNLIIDGELTPDATDFVTTPRITSRPRTTAEVSWSVADWTNNGDHGADQRTSDLAPIIQEIVSQRGWATGNSLVLIFSDNPANPSTGIRCAEAHDGSTSGAPLLHIEYIAGGAKDPQPADGATVIHASVELTWSPGDYVASSRVFFGDDSANVEAGIGGTDKGVIYWTGYPVSGLLPDTTYYWRIEEVNNLHPDSPWEGQIWSFTTVPANATNPYPSDGSTNVRDDVVMTWDPGMNMVFQNIFIGADYNTVLNETVPAAYTTDSQFEASGYLERGRTYYWRIDTHDTCGVPHKGQVWTFQTMQDIPITDPDLVGWWTFEEQGGDSALDFSGHENTGFFVGDPNRVVGYDGSALYLDGDDFMDIGLVADDIDGNDITLSAWIKTSTSASDWFSVNTSDGSRNTVLVAIDGGEIAINEADYPGGGYHAHSTTRVDDDQWHLVTYVRDGNTGYVYIDGFLEGTHDAYFTLAGDDRWSIGQEWDDDTPTEFLTGLVDDVRVYKKPLTELEVKQLMRIDPDMAWNPLPRPGSTLSIDDFTNLSWSRGDHATLNDVYFGTDAQMVAAGDSRVFQGRRTANTFNPTNLVLGKTYYWRIDQFNGDSSVTAGNVWSFSLIEYVVIDDFESYGEVGTPGEDGARIWFTWSDGFGYRNPAPGSTGNGSGSIVDLTDAVVDGGAQAMIVDYDNTGGFTNIWGTSVPAHYSRVDLDPASVSAGSDWTVHGIKALALSFRGYPESTGSFTANGGDSYTVTASGADIWDLRYPWEDVNDPYHDEFHFAYITPPAGTNQIIARVDSVVDTNPWAKAGIMMRNTLDPGSVHAFVCVTPGQGVAFQRRSVDGGASLNVNTAADPQPTAPQWIKLERDIQGLCSASYSADGANWIALGGPNQVDLNTPIYMGLAVTSHDAGATTTAVFSNVTIGGSSVTGLQSTDIGILSNSPDELYVELSDGVHQARVAHSDAAAVTDDAYDQWNIALSDFAGVNLANVTRLSVGVGRNSPMAGGTGRIYVDDIRLYAPRFLSSMLVQRPSDYIYDGIINHAELQVMAEDWLIEDSVAQPLAVWYEFDGDASDSGPKGLHGTLENGPTFTAGVGGLGSAIDCNGVDHYVDVDANAVDLGIADNAPRTAAAWVYVRSFNSGGIFEVGENVDGAEFALRVRSTDGQWRVQYGGNINQSIDGHDTSGQWAHVAVTFDGGFSRMYMDGSLVSTMTVRLNTGVDDNLRIGRWNDNYFDGLIDDLRIYTRALSQSEITTAMSGSPVTGTYHPVPSPMNLADPEPSGSRTVNFVDLSVLLDTWGQWQLWP